ncbi:MAG: beta-lactamase [Verrucomicrobiaceae bacterium]|nr:beta-lactamase [Verrucomicrobiaceae bacterium]
MRWRRQMYEANKYCLNNRKRWPRVIGSFLFSAIVLCGAAVAAPVAYVDSLRLYAIDCGHLDILDMAWFADTGEHAGEKGEMAAPCFLIRHPKGDLLWDTGLGDRLAALPDGEANAVAVSRVRVTLQSQLQQLGLKPSDINYVAFSHLHADHAGNANLFGGATWLIDPVELKWALSKPAPLGVDSTLLGAAAHAKIISTAIDYDVFGDGSVRILKAHGHTPGHQILMLQLPRAGAIILSGDLFHTRENYEKSLVPPTNVSRADTLASFNRVAGLVKNMHARVIVQHSQEDFAAFPHFPEFLQ